MKLIVAIIHDDDVRHTCAHYGDCGHLTEEQDKVVKGPKLF